LKRLGTAILAGMIAGSFRCPSPASAQPVVASPRPVASAAPAPVADASAPVRATLANGMHVVLLPNKLAPVATTLMSYDVGDADDTLPGIAHATEHMLFRGTTNLSGGQLAEIAARMGASYNAMTADESTLYYYKLPAAYVDLALRIEADRMTNATIRAADWATERGAIEQEIRAQESAPSHTISTTLRETFFAGTPFATASGGTVPSFEKMTADDIRAFYHRWYQPANATLIVAGDIDPAQVLAQVHARFDATPAGTPPVRKPVVVPPLASASLQATIDFPVGFGVLAYRLPGSDAADYAAARVLGEVLDGGRTAFADLAADGKVLAVLPVTNVFPELGAAFLLGIPANGKPADSVQPLLAGVLDAYRKDGIPPELVDAAKLKLLSEQSYRESSISGLGFAWAEAAEMRQPTPDAIYQAVASVTADDVNRIVRTYLSPEHQLSMLITAKPTHAMAKTDPSAGVEHVGFTPNAHEPLPDWAQLALKAPLRAPSEDLTATVHRLRNGLRYAARRETAAPTVVLSGFVRTDPLLYVPAGKDGLGQIVDGMLGWGTPTYERKAYQAQFDAIAGTAKLGTTFSLQVQAKDFERGVELLADGLLHPVFPAAGFAVVKSAEAQSVAVLSELPKAKAELAQRRALYAPGDPRRREATARTVAAIDLADVKNYYRTAYRPDETTVAVVGDISPERAGAALEKYFGAWTAAGSRPSFRYPTLRGSARRAQTVTVKSSTNTQSEVTLKQVFRMSRSDADYVPLLLANTILSGEGTGSLLFEELRTRRGYVYTTDSNVSVDSNGAEFSISYASDAKNVAPANAALVAIIKRLQTHALPAVELQRAKALLLAQRVLPLDSYTGVADDMLAGSKVGLAFTGSESYFWHALLATTPAQVQHALHRIDPDHFLRVVVEPGK
jgi:zinc protease